MIVASTLRAADRCRSSKLSCSRGIRRLTAAGQRAARALLNVALLTFSLALAAPADAQEDGSDARAPAPGVMERDAEGRVTVRAVRIAAPPRIDGVLDEGVYGTLAPITGFIQQEPNEGAIATEPTLVWILFDEQHLYIAARCRDSQPARILANDMRRDGRNVSQNDNLSVIIDTFHDRRNGYEFLVNAIGGAWDTQVTDEVSANRDWNTVWRSRARRDDDGWTVEMEIPFRSVRYRGSGPQTWGINVRRSVRWKNEVSYLSQVPRQYGARGILRLSQAATLAGLELPAPALNLDVKPFAVAGTTADRSLDPSFRDDLDGDAGIDVKYGVTQSLAADFTYRTDFAQVEDDDQQVNLTRFNLLYPEKREFFLEGQGIFAFGGTTPSTSNTTAPATPVNTPVLFFSRRIGLERNADVPIEAGARLTGKAGRYSIGLLDIRTDESRAARTPGTNFAVVRLKRDILRRSYVGLIATHRTPNAGAVGENLAFGLDTTLSFFQSLSLIGYYAGTRTTGVRGDDRSYRARFDYDADALGVQVERLAVGRHFMPEVGFLRRTDFIQNLAQFRVSRRPKTRRAIRKISYEAGIDYITDGEHRLENRQARAGVRTEMQNGDAWNVSYMRDFEFVDIPFPVAGRRVPAGAYHMATVRGTYTFGFQRRVTGDVTVAQGGLYGGERTEIGYRGRAELTPRLSIEPGVSVNWLELPGGRITATLVSGRTNFSFSPRMLVAALLQYNSTSSSMTTNLRFRWEYQPGSELFLVYSDGRDTLQRGFPQLLNRGFTVKMTRLFQF